MGQAEPRLQRVSRASFVVVGIPARSTVRQRRRRSLREAVVERVAGAAHGANRGLLAARIEQLAQAADMHVDGALVDIDVAAPDAVEQLLAGEHPAGVLKEEFEQAVFGRTEIDWTARARDAALLAVELDVAIGEH